MSASSAEARAIQLVEEAQKKLKPSLFSFLSNKTEEAAELLEKAAGQYKIAKLCKQVPIQLYFFPFVFIIYKSMYWFSEV